MKVLLTTAEVADLFGVHPKTVRRWAQDGRLPAIRNPGGQFGFRRDDVEKALGNAPLAKAAS
jgi:excisionase family DNA binding protein